MLSRLIPLRRLGDERGVSIVLFAFLLPVFLAFGAITLDVGNWYVHRRHLQTQVDSAALAGGGMMYGCLEDPTGTDAAATQQALKYAGDPTRPPTNGPLSNQQVGASTKVHVVLNSTNYWSSGTATDGTGYDGTDVSTDPNAPKLGPAGGPCYNGYLDAKATDDAVSNLWGLVPFHPSPKTNARVEMRPAVSMRGVLPLGVPEFDQRWVAAIVVNEDAANWQTNPNAVRGANFLTQLTPSPTGPPDLSPFNVYQGTLAGVNLNGASDFGVFILRSRSASAPSLSGSLDTICGQTPVPAAQLECNAYDGAGTDVSFIHSYSDSSPQPAARDVKLVGGCGSDLSAPYFNLNAGCPIVIQADLDLGVPTHTDPGANGYCYNVTDSQSGGAMTWADSGGDGTWSSSFTPLAGSGKNVVNITVTQSAKLSNCTGKTSTVATFPSVAAAYAADDNSGAVQYLWVTSGGVAANSINQPSSANLLVTVGLAPPIVDAPPGNPPILFRLGDFSTPSQTQALDCGASGAAGWRNAILNGCAPYSTNQRNGICTTPFPNPAAPDCIDSENGKFSIGSVYAQRFTPNGCVADPNNWYRNGYTLPPPTDPRWAQLFDLDNAAFSSPGKKTFPIRRFINVYVTAGEGINCPGDVPASAGRNELWGHVVSYVSPDPDATASTTLCTYKDGGVCVPVLVQ